MTVCELHDSRHWPDLSLPLPLVLSIFIELYMIDSEKSASGWFDQFDPRAMLGVEKAIHLLIPEGKGAVMLIGDAESSPLKLPLQRIPVFVSPESKTNADGNRTSLDYIFTFCSSELSTAELRKGFSAAYEVLEEKGTLVVAFFDPVSRAARKICPALQSEEPQLEKIMFELSHCGFRQFQFMQAVFDGSEEAAVSQPPRPGFGEGLLVIIKAKKNPRL